MKKKLKIGWQKYEDLIEQQLSSPLLEMIKNKMLEDVSPTETSEYEDTEYEDEAQGAMSILPISSQMLQDLATLSHYDCWIGHTNFDITPTIKKSLNNVGGVEVLKIFSRYRFFIGVGKMFDFKTVRYNIEDLLLNNKEDDYGNGTRLEDSESDE